MAQAQPEPTLPPRNPFIHNAAIAGAILAPVAMALPPRKIDIRFFVLAGCFSLATNQLAYEYTGQSIYSRFGNRASNVMGFGIPEGAQRTQQLLKEHKEREAARKQAQKEADAKADKNTGLIKDIWMGGEDENWSEKRAEEHRKSFQEGKGLSDIILEQVMDVASGNWKGSSSKKGDDERIPSDESRSDKK
ncbi:hypothetical protein HIM_06474 [Hirsutella minnesotensis 3608]|uniref:Rhomboid family membrane protein n=1 Tax=Hirsutella minnesotensis 3608 TaxID=1043627 RepID=A0A0F7ZU49_9HYPO|nr:hypothetical protein HIM_06474 [Hirsutella minnesotensis 3608]